MLVDRGFSDTDAIKLYHHVMRVGLEQCEEKTEFLTAY